MRKVNGSLLRRLMMPPLFLLVAALTLSVFGLLGAPDAASRVTTIAISPASQTVDVGQEFTTDVVINDAAEFQGADIDISYDAAVLEVVGYTNGSILPNVFSPEPSNICDNTTGTCNYIAVRLGASFTGSGTLFTITWRFREVGASNIDILGSTQLATGSGQPIPYTATDGSAMVQGATPAPTPTPTVTPTPTPGDLPIHGQLGSCLAVTNVVWRLDNQGKEWDAFDPDVPSILQDLRELVAGDGYLINVSVDCSIASGEATLNLPSGWNVFSWPPVSPAAGIPTQQALGACLDDTNVAYGHDNQAKQWKAFQPGAPDLLQTLTEFVPGNGYFANTSADCTINSGPNDINLYTSWNLFGWR